MNGTFGKVRPLRFPAYARVACFFSLVLFAGNSISCAPTRAPVPPGEIPSTERLEPGDVEAGVQARQALTEQFPISDDPVYRQRVDRVVKRLLAATDSKQEWQVTVLDGDEIVNAAATRGNQIFVWSGMLQKVDSEGELAAVLAHEVAHVLAGHVVPDQAELFNRMLAQLAGAATGALAAKQSPGLANVAGGLAEKTVQGVIVNPYTQRMELEADTIGLFLMADADYDPRAALDFWRDSGSSTSKVAAFFSTHPLSSERLQRLERYIPEALARYHR
ncbi:MAG: M48 family metallopeptidase [Bdellovibrionales bacterium]|nr:M48 family metallopeptidase [Bdellovibrionales bacterium]